MCKLFLTHERSVDLDIEKDLEKVKSSLHELAGAVKESPQYQKYLQCEQALENDGGARQLLEEFNRYQSSLGLDRETAEKARRLEGVIHENRVIRDYIQARKEMAELCQEAESVINEILQFDFGGACVPRGGCC